MQVFIGNCNHLFKCMNISSFGKVIRGKRESLKLSRETLALKVGASASAIQSWEKGKAKPKYEYRGPLSKALGIDINALLEKGVDEPSPLYGTEEKVSIYNKEGVSALSAVDEWINIKEAMGKAYKVLLSNTPYAVALYLNIQQFSNALDTGTALKICLDEIQELKNRVDELKKQVDRLTAVPTTAAASEDSSEEAAM